MKYFKMLIAAAIVDIVVFLVYTLLASNDEYFVYSLLVITFFPLVFYIDKYYDNGLLLWAGISLIVLIINWSIIWVGECNWLFENPDDLLEMISMLGLVSDVCFDSEPRGLYDFVMDPLSKAEYTVHFLIVSYLLHIVIGGKILQRFRYDN